MKKISFLLVLIFLVAAISCNNKSKKKNKLQNMEWLLGTWQMDAYNGKQNEEWVKENDTLFSGKSYMVFNTDTIIMEYLNLQLIKNELFYIPIVLNQNDSEPVSFKMIGNRDSNFVFQNKQHDFPQKITYKQIGKDSLHAWIEGTQNRKQTKKDYFMSRK